MEKKYYIGEIVNTQGIKGEIRVVLFEGYDNNFENFKFFYIDGEKYEIEKFRFKKNLLILKLKGLDDINDAELLIKKKLYLFKNDIKLEDNEFLIDEVIGFDVYYNDDKIGIIKDIDLKSTSQGVIVIGNGKETFMVPLHLNFIKKRDMENKCMYLKNIEGLI